MPEAHAKASFQPYEYKYSMDLCKRGMRSEHLKDVSEEQIYA